MVKYGFGAGHGGNDPGAVAQGNVEATIARVVNAAMVACGNQRGNAYGTQCIDLTVDKGYPYNINEPCNIANSSGVAVAIQNHFNAGGGNGCEVLYYAGDANAAYFAYHMSLAISRAYGLQNRGAKPRSDLGFLNQTNMMAFIIEWGFVDAPGNIDCPKILADPTKGVNAVLDQLGFPPVAAPTPPTPVAPKPVDQGDRRIQLYTPNRSDAQKWKRVKTGDYHKYVNVASGKVLDVRGGQLSKDPLTGRAVQVYPDNNTDAQLWREEVVQANDSPDTFVILHTKLDDSYVLDVVGGAKDAKVGSALCVHPYHGGLNQKFTFVYAGTPGHYWIHGLENDLNIDVVAAGRLE